MKLAKFIHYGGSEMPRSFLHHAEWAFNEVRTITKDEAKELKAHFPGAFEFSDPDKAPAEQPASSSPAEPAKE